MTSKSKEVFHKEFKFIVEDSVYEPAEDSFFFAENLSVKAEDKVLDMGTGCGILGIVAAVTSGEVVAIDVNPFAVKCAKDNARSNGLLGRMFFVQSDLFSAIKVGAGFDVILFNAPYLPTDDSEGDAWSSRAWAGGQDGRRVIDHFIEQAPTYLKQDGHALLLQSSLSDPSNTLQMFERLGMQAQVLAEKALPLFETLVLVRAQHRTP